MTAMASNPRSDRSVGVALIGCGNVAEHYVRALVDMPEVGLVGAFDVDSDRLHRFTDQHRLARLTSLDQALRRDQVTIVLNLTVPSQHHSTRSALEAETSLLREAAGVDITRSPGPVRAGSDARAQAGRRPGQLAGPIRQCGALPPGDRCAWSSPGHLRARRSRPSGAMASPAAGHSRDGSCHRHRLVRARSADRPTWPSQEGKGGGAAAKHTSRNRSFTIDRDDFVAASHSCRRSFGTCNFYVDGSRSGGEAIEFHGDEGSLYLSSWAATNAAVWTVDGNGTAHHLMSEPGSASAIDWSLGIGDLINAVVSNREPQDPQPTCRPPSRGGRGHRTVIRDRTTVFLNSAFPTPPPPRMPLQRSLRDGHGKSRPDSIRSRWCPLNDGRRTARLLIVTWTMRATSQRQPTQS